MIDEHPDEHDNWMTYAQAAEILGLSVEAVRTIARRQKRPRRSPNAIGGQAWVVVPIERLTNGHDRLRSTSSPLSSPPGSSLSKTTLPVGQPTLPIEHTDERLTSIDDRLDELLTVMRGELLGERKRADRAEQKAQEAEE